MYLIKNITHKKDKKDRDYNKTVNFSFKNKQLMEDFSLKPNQSITVESPDVPIKIKELIFKGLLEMSIVPKQKKKIELPKEKITEKKVSYKTTIKKEEIKDNNDKKYTRKTKKDEDIPIYK